MVLNLIFTLQTNITTLPSARARLLTTLSKIESLISTPGPNYQVFLRMCEGQNSSQNDQLVFQGMSLSGRRAFLTNQDAGIPLVTGGQKLIRETVKFLKERFSNLLGAQDNDEPSAAKTVAVLALCFQHDAWPEDRAELITYGDEMISYLVEFYKDILVNRENILQQWSELKVRIQMEFRDKTWTSLWSMILTKEPYKTL